MALYSLNRRPGVALLNAMLFTALMTILMIVGVRYTTATTAASRKVKHTEQVYHLARAGLTDGLNYFRKQTALPPVFNPTPDPSSAPRGDTNDPYFIDPGNAMGKDRLGLVQEYELDANTGLWGRYEIGKMTRVVEDAAGRLREFQVYQPSPSPAGWVGLADATSDVWEGVTDISEQQGFTGAGVVWRVNCQAYVYVKGPAPLPSGIHFYQAPNRVLDQVALQTEFRQLQIFDYQAAVRGKQGEDIKFYGGTDLLITGNTVPAVRWQNNATPSPGIAPTSFTGSPVPFKKGATEAINWNQAFGVPDAATLAGMADFNVVDVSELPKPLSSMALIYIRPPVGVEVEFNAAKPLNGGGILVVDGDLKLDADASTNFEGYIYVTGNLDIDGPAEIRGQIVAAGNIKLRSPSSTSATRITYSSAVIENLRLQLGQYREVKSAMKVL